VEERKGSSTLAAAALSTRTTLQKGRTVPIRGGEKGRKGACSTPAAHSRLQQGKSSPGALDYDNNTTKKGGPARVLKWRKKKTIQVPFTPLSTTSTSGEGKEKKKGKSRLSCIFNEGGKKRKKNNNTEG